MTKKWDGETVYTQLAAARYDGEIIRMALHPFDDDPVEGSGEVDDQMFPFRVVYQHYRYHGERVPSVDFGWEYSCRGEDTGNDDPFCPGDGVGFLAHDVPELSDDGNPDILKDLTVDDIGTDYAALLWLIQGEKE